ncbi:deoxyhypusine synthase [Natronospira proteinivora]|uniref:Deoxyhypusine synthase n=1 Tax=Natronospira proteinivora TaxID=1807133 RepID=A0ABT1GB07_9GAMM|nr:deoxyhypusine synthase family protein [Natronospira proteinivora]MCP1727503.1 deoxyhypusine synthase [Natronospira proteinivora]
MGGIREFIDSHYHHFNARELKAASQALLAHLDSGGRLFISLAGAMSTAQLGKSLAPAIRQGMVHGICCTGANLEEDVFRLMGGNRYVSLPNWRDLTPADEQALNDRQLNRVTDTAIPDEVMQQVEEQLITRWRAAADSGRSAMPSEFMQDLLRDPGLRKQFQDPESSWLLAATERQVPVWTPGWEDSSSGNAFSAAVMRGEVSSHSCVMAGTEQMNRLVRWYLENCDPEPGIAYLQVGGGIAGDFAICVTPLISRELQMPDTPRWGYFCQISDADSSYGGYSGAPENEKITWSKLGPETPRFNIHSDATIVMPLMLAYLLDM